MNKNASLDKKLMRLETKLETAKNPDSMKALQAMAKLLQDADRKIEKIEADLVKANKERQKIASEDIPALMEELEMRSFELTNGRTIEVIEEMKCGITKENKPKAHQWLKDNGAGGLIATVVYSEFGKDEETAANKFIDKAQRLTNHPLIVEESIHWKRLHSYVTEQRKKGKKIPTDLFSIFTYVTTEIKESENG